MKLIAFFTLLFQIALIGFSIQQIHDGSHYLGLWVACILCNIVFGAINVRTLVKY